MVASKRRGSDNIFEIRSSLGDGFSIFSPATVKNATSEPDTKPDDINNTTIAPEYIK